MARKKAARTGEPTADDMLRAEREVGENLPDEMMGVEGADVGHVQRKGKEVDPLHPDHD